MYSLRSIAKTASSTTRLNTLNFARMSSTLTTVSSKNAPPAAASYSHAVKANGFIYVSGQIPFTAEGKPVEGQIGDRADQVIKNVLAILKDSNSSLERIVKVNIFLTDMGNFGAFNEVYAKYFSVHKPARSCVAVAALPLGVDVEMEVVALEN